MVEDHLAIHDDSVDAFGPLHPPWRAGWPIVPDFVLSHANTGQIEEHEVRRQTLAYEAAVAQAHEASRLEGETAHGIFEAEELPLPHPLAQHVRRLASGAEIGVEMRPGIRLRGDGMATFHQLRQPYFFLRWPHGDLELGLQTL
jgi:hypothetical protein